MIVQRLIMLDSAGAGLIDFKNAAEEVDDQPDEFYELVS